MYINDRPTDRRIVWKISNGDISTTGHPNDPIMFGSIYTVFRKKHPLTVSFISP